MAKNKGRKKIKLASTEPSAGGGKHYYTTSVPQRAEKKLELKKYNPELRRHVLYKEEKLPS